MIQCLHHAGIDRIQILSLHGVDHEAAIGPFIASVLLIQRGVGHQANRRNITSTTGDRIIEIVFAVMMDNAPDGDYVVFRFASSFEHKQAATETVTGQMEKDGNWRISGYFIR